MGESYNMNAAFYGTVAASKYSSTTDNDGDKVLLDDVYDDAKESLGACSHINLINDWSVVLLNRPSPGNQSSHSLTSLLIQALTLILHVRTSSHTRGCTASTSRSAIVHDIPQEAVFSSLEDPAMMIIATQLSKESSLTTTRSWETGSCLPTPNH